MIASPSVLKLSQFTPLVRFKSKSHFFHLNDICIGPPSDSIMGPHHIISILVIIITIMILIENTYYHIWLSTQLFLLSSMKAILTINWNCDSSGTVIERTRVHVWPISKLTRNDRTIEWSNDRTIERSNDRMIERSIDHQQAFWLAKLSVHSWLFSFQLREVEHNSLQASKQVV